MSSKKQNQNKNTKPGKSIKNTKTKKKEILNGKYSRITH